MVNERFKKACNEATDFIVSCWDENNPDDGLSFDERVQSRLNDLDPDVKRIVSLVVINDECFV